MGALWRQEEMLQDLQVNVFGDEQAKMRNYLEHLEPGVHRYFPIRLRSEVPIGGKTEHGELFLLIEPPLLDCLDIEATQFAKGFGTSGWKEGKDGISRGSLSSRPGSKCTLKNRWWKVTTFGARILVTETTSTPARTNSGRVSKMNFKSGNRIPSAI